MYTLTEGQLGAYLDHIVDRIQHIRQMNLSTEADLQVAMQQSQETLGALALFRRQLSRVADNEQWSQRRVA